jgi:hypothetical protein
MKHSAFPNEFNITLVNHRMQWVFRDHPDSHKLWAVEATSTTGQKTFSEKPCLQCDEIVTMAIPQASVEVLGDGKFWGYLHLRCRAECQDAHPGFTYTPVTVRDNYPIIS